MKSHPARPQHEDFYQDLIALLKKHTEGMSPLEMLAVASNMVGKLVALQDQRAITPKHAMELVAKNIEEGNQQTLEKMTEPAGRA